MPTYQIQKHEVIGRHNKWTQAFGLKPRSFLRADGQTPVGRESAINKFLLDTKRCKKNLILVELPEIPILVMVALSLQKLTHFIMFRQ